jgi:hypothetical protein
MNATVKAHTSRKAPPISNPRALILGNPAILESLPNIIVHPPKLGPIPGAQETAQWKIEARPSEPLLPSSEKR